MNGRHWHIGTPRESLDDRAELWCLGRRHRSSLCRRSAMRSENQYEPTFATSPTTIISASPVFRRTTLPVPMGAPRWLHGLGGLCLKMLVR